MSGVGPAELLIILVIVGVVFAPTLVAFFVGYLVGQKRSGSPSSAAATPATAAPPQAATQPSASAAPSQVPAPSEAPSNIAPEVSPAQPEETGDDSENGDLHV